MVAYKYFVGIDMGKFSFVVSQHSSKVTTEYENSSVGIAQFINEHHDILPESFCVLETTGGYELELAYSLLAHGFKVHRADTRKVKNFIRSFGSTAKTDALDAKALAAYACERHEKLNLFEVQSRERLELFQLVQRRNDLKMTLVAEKNRLQAPTNTFIKDSISAVIAAINEQVTLITDQINLIIKNDPILKKKKEALKTVPGIGDVIAFELLTRLPELGSLCRRKIASLAGVAPRSNDSGTFNGYRRTGHGRSGIKPILFLAAMSARNSKTQLKEFYEKLINKGKKKMVALTALMRKVLIIANARLKELDSSTMA